MKKLNAIAIAAAVLLLAGCGQENVEYYDPDSAPETIGFNPFFNGQAATRAKEFGYWGPGEKLSVRSFLTSNTATDPAPTMFELNYEGPFTTSWTYSPLVNVSKPPLSRTYYAYYPASPNISNAHFNGESGSFDYVVREASSQEDLIAAKTVTAYARVPLLFRRLMSQINFALQEEQGIKISLSNIRVNNVANRATYTFAPGGGSWTLATGSLATTDNYPYTPVDGVTFPTDGQSSDVIYFGNKGGGNANDNGNTNALMLMPQSFESGKGANVTFEYVLTGMDNVEVKRGSALFYFGDFNIKSWEMGKRYLYLIDMSGLIEEGPITFEAVMFGWDDGVKPGGVNTAQTVIIAEGSQLLLEKAITVHNTKKALTPSFTVFPIAMKNSPMDGWPGGQLYLKDFSDGNFVSGDQIRINCFSYGDATRIMLDASKESTWRLQGPTAPGSDPETEPGTKDVVLIKQ